MEGHKKASYDLAAAVEVVTVMVDESDQQVLVGQLEKIMGQYSVLRFNSRCYLVERWLEDREAELCSMAPAGVLVSSVHVSYCYYYYCYMLLLL